MYAAAIGPDTEVSHLFRPVPSLAPDDLPGYLTRFPLPEAEGDRAVQFYNRYFTSGCPHERRLRRDINCHIFTAAVKGWLEIGMVDQNIFGWGAADITDESYPFVSPAEVRPGEAYGVVSNSRPNHLLHSFVGIDKSRHIAVNRNLGSLVIAGNEPVMDFYSSRIEYGAAQLRHMNKPLSVLGTDHWLHMQVRDRMGAIARLQEYGRQTLLQTPPAR